jgi:hypothetical protein
MKKREAFRRIFRPRVQLNKERAEHQLSAGGVLSGVTFAALVLIIQSKEAFAVPAFITFVSYTEILIIGMAITSLLFIFSTVGMVQIAAERVPSLDAESHHCKDITRRRLSEREKSNAENYIRTISSSFSAAFYGLMIMLPLLVLPLSILGAIVIIVFESVSLIFFVKYGLDFD